MKKLVVFGLVILGFACFFLFKPEEEVKNDSTSSLDLFNFDDVVLGDVLVHNIFVTDKNGLTTFSSKVTNLTSNELSFKCLKIIIQCDDKESVLYGYFGGLKSEEEKVVTAQTNMIFDKIDDISFELQ